MLKHILTTACPRSCAYCITRNVPKSAPMNLTEILDRYELLASGGHKSIMLTGGEPTVHPSFAQIVTLASLIWPGNVFVTTASAAGILRMRTRPDIAGITFSDHDQEYLPIPKGNAPIYAAIMQDRFDKNSIERYYLSGYSGLTINEDQRGTEAFDESLLKHPYKDFSVKLNRRGHCMEETIMLPNGEIITSFGEYL